jgi:hypothetical protein
MKKILLIIAFLMFFTGVAQAGFEYVILDTRQEEDTLWLTVSYGDIDDVIQIAIFRPITGKDINLAIANRHESELLRQETVKEAMAKIALIKPSIDKDINMLKTVN